MSRCFAGGTLEYFALLWGFRSPLLALGLYAVAALDPSSAFSHD
jgi:hypothetical protein